MVFAVYLERVDDSAFLTFTWNIQYEIDSTAGWSHVFLILKRITSLMISPGEHAIGDPAWALLDKAVSWSPFHSALTILYFCD